MRHSVRSSITDRGNGCTASTLRNVWICTSRRSAHLKHILSIYLIGLKCRPRAHEHREEKMAYVVTDAYIKCKYMDCVEVCPVDCFYEGENMLVIHPDECIDCGVCEPECPADAIKPDTEPGLDKWLQLNTEYAPKWPNITIKRDAPADAKEVDGVA